MGGNRAVDKRRHLARLDAALEAVAVGLEARTPSGQHAALVWARGALVRARADMAEAPEDAARREEPDVDQSATRGA